MQFSASLRIRCNKDSTITAKCPQIIRHNTSHKTNFLTDFFHAYAPSVNHTRLSTQLTNHFGEQLCVRQLRDEHYRLKQDLYETRLKM